MIDEVIAECESLLLISQFTEVDEVLARSFRRHYTPFYLHGSTARRQREPALFIHWLKAGGVGITLTWANHLFHFDHWWRPAIEIQATIVLARGRMSSRPKVGDPGYARETRRPNTGRETADGSIHCQHR